MRVSETEDVPALPGGPLSTGTRGWRRRKDSSSLGDETASGVRSQGTGPPSSWETREQLPRPPEEHSSGDTLMLAGRTLQNRESTWGPEATELVVTCYSSQRGRMGSLLALSWSQRCRGSRAGALGPGAVSTSYHEGREARIRGQEASSGRRWKWGVGMSQGEHSLGSTPRGRSGTSRATAARGQGGPPGRRDRMQSARRGGQEEGQVHGEQEVAGGQSLQGRCPRKLLVLGGQEAGRALGARNPRLHPPG